MKRGFLDNNSTNCRTLGFNGSSESVESGVPTPGPAVLVNSSSRTSTTPLTTSNDIPSPHSTSMFKVNDPPLQDNRDEAMRKRILANSGANNICYTMTPFNLPNFPNAFIVCFIDAEAKAKHVAQLADFRAAEYVNRLACKDSSRPTVKGQMMVATCDLREGETVVREWPLLLWPQRFFVGSVEQAEHFLSLAVNNLNPVRGAEYRSLKNAWKDYTGSDFRGAGELSGILNTNMVRISGSPATDDCPYGGIFPSLSRMNHSCQPNSSYNYDSHTMTIELRASRSIRKGEEVTISYNCELMQPTVARRGRLFDTYRFTCECGACTAASSDARRAQILATPHTTRREFFTWLASRHLAVQQPQFADDYLIDRAKVGYALYAREKLVEPVLVESLTHAETIMGCYLARGMGREAKFWAGKVRGHMLSHFLPESRDAKVGPTSPEKSELWNGREKFEGREQP